MYPNKVILFFTLQVLSLVMAGASEHTYLVKSVLHCPSQEYLCLTLDDYAANQSEFFISNSTFLFLPGNHTTKTVVNLANVSNILLKAKFDSNPELFVTDWSFECFNVSDIVVQGLTLKYTGFKVNTISAFFHSNSILLTDLIFQGGRQGHQNYRATSLSNSIAIFNNCTFRENKGVQFGGAVYILEQSNAIISNSMFVGNNAQTAGGAVSVSQSELSIYKSSFIRNSASQAGGIRCHGCSLFTSSVHFINNTAPILSGGAVVTKNAKVVFSNITAISNSETALLFYQSRIKFNGRSIFKDNEAILSAVGGALHLILSTVTFSGYTLFENNCAFNGGAIAALVKSELIFTGITEFINNIAIGSFGGAVAIGIHTKLEIHGLVLFERNNCTSCLGGAIAAADTSTVSIFDAVTFNSNSAMMGGAIYLRYATLVLNQGARLDSVSNYAQELGGGIFIEDDSSYYQCFFTMNSHYLKEDVLETLPDCFLKLENFSFTNVHQYKILSINDTAGSDGEFMFGGLMDKCHIVDYYKLNWDLLYNVVFKYNILQILPSIDHDTSKYAISSFSFTLCFCETEKNFNCTEVKQISTLRGGKFNVSVVALSQGNGYSLV